VNQTESDRSPETLYPLFLLLKGKRVLLVGGGTVALRKAETLWDSGYQLTVVSKRFSLPFREWIRSRSLAWEERPYRDTEAGSFFLVVSATDDPEVNRRVYEDACRAERLINVADQPHLCNFFVPSVVKRGALQVAISSSGDCPALTRRIRTELDRILPERYGPLLERLAAVRRELRERLPTPALRKEALEQLLASESVKRFLDGDEDRLESEIRERIPPPGNLPGF